MPQAATTPMATGRGRQVDAPGTSSSTHPKPRYSSAITKARWVIVAARAPRDRPSWVKVRARAWALRPSRRVESSKPQIDAAASSP